MPDMDRVLDEKQPSNIAQFVSSSVALVKAQLKDPAKPFALMVRFQVKEGTQERCEAAFAAAGAPTRNEQGCLAFDLNRDAADEARYVTYERWKSLADLETHLQTPYVTFLIIDLLDMLAGPPELQVLAALGESTGELLSSARPRPR